jgi:outer membrane cobalamin receptor
MPVRLFAVHALLLATSLSAEIRGVVKDPSGAPVAGALVHLLGGPSARTITDATGAYKFAVKSHARYTVVAGAPGLAGKPVTVDYSGAPVTADIQLELAARTESINVTAERSEIPAATVASAATIITRRELDELHAENVEDALRLVPGLVVNQTGSRGNVGSVFARGADPKMSLVLVDGVPINQFGGTYNFANLPVENVERIEVVRGPQSALYGTNAIGAVIQVITRRPGVTPEFRAQAEGGSFAYARGHIGGGARLGRFGWNVDLQRLSSDGQAPNDDYRNETASLYASWDAATNGRLSYSFTANANESGAVGPWGSNPAGIYTGFNRISRSKENAYRHGIRYEMRAGRLTQRFDGAIYDQNFVFRSPFGESVTSNFRGAFTTQSEIALARSDSLVAGFEYQRERVRNSFLADTTGRLTPVERDNFGYFVENRYEYRGRFFLNTGIRLEDVRTGAIPAIQFGPANARRATAVLSVNPKLSAAWTPRINGATRFHGSAGTGLRSPDGFELAFTDNPELRPERTTSFDLGVEQTFYGRRVALDLTYFHNRFHDLIVTLGPSLRALSRWSSDNLSNSRAQGLEFTYALRPLASLRMNGHYTWLATRLLSLDGAPGSTAAFFRVGQRLIRRPEHSAAYHLVWSRGRFLFDTGAEFRSKVLDIEPNFGASAGLYRNPGYVRPDLGLEIALTREVAIYGRLRNFLDDRYEETYGFPSLRRTFVAGVRIRWDRQ